MKAIIMTVALSLIAALGVTGQTETGKATAPLTLKCTRPDGGACTAQRVQGLALAVKAAGKGSRPALAGIKTLSLASSDGTLQCKQTNGKPCTAGQMRLVREVSAASEVTISLSGGNSN